MHVHDGVPVVGRHLEQHVVADDTGVVDQDGRGAELGLDALERGSDLLLVADVGADGERRTASRGDRFDRAGAGRLVEVDDGDLESVGGQALGHSGADASGSSGDDRGTGFTHGSAPSGGA